MKTWNLKGIQSSISEALRLELPDHAVISVVGAGGKTSLIFAWAKQLAESGKSVIVTTTTHMRHPYSTSDEIFNPYIDVVSLIQNSVDSADLLCRDINDNLAKHGVVFVAATDPDNPRKVIMPSSEIMDYIYTAADVILVEADGSRHMPFKYPSEHEPVIPDCTDITVCVTGLSAFGKNTQDVMYCADVVPDNIYRDTVDETFMRAVLASPDGGAKGFRGEYRVFLNQADNEKLQAVARKLQKMLAVSGIQSAWGTLLPDSCEPRIAVILEAAGNSVRFGSNKLMHIMYDGRPMISGVLDAVNSSDWFKKIIVTQYDEVSALVPDYDVVINERPDLGISHSMQLGIEAAGEADAYMFCVCDQPGLTNSSIEALTEAYKKGTAGIVSLAWQGRMCNPKIFSSCYRDELMTLSGDVGGRQIISAHRDDLLLVEAACEEETMDIDSLDTL
ncbi:MAG: putative selenium-dependent hydroxylase accessory protein YqeC [Clostridiales bacterium]|nr:putative selenium-dependent hydroxylase accessory protein YqeC [Candidatus Crickella caballi]